MTDEAQDQSRHGSGRTSSGRIEDQRFLTGRGTYTDDLRPAAMLHARFVRSEMASAKVERIGAEAALAVPGVVAVLTGADLADRGPLPIDFSPQRDDGGRPWPTPRPVLADRRVVHLGQPLALVVAETDAAARDGAEAVEVALEAGPTVVSAEAALVEGAVRVWPEAEDNVAFHRRLGDAGATEAAFAGAAHVIRRRFSISRVAAVTMEPRATLALSGDGGLELVTGNQRPGALRQGLAGWLGLSPEKVRVRSVDIGGSFGMKAGLYAEDFALAAAAMRLGRPVGWACDRSEAFLSDDQGRDTFAEAELALDAGLRFLALRARILSNVGSHVSPRSQGMVGNITGLAGVYRIPAALAEVVGVFTHTCLVAPYRGNGRPEATYILERLVDEAARELAADPAELRRRNLVASAEMPWKTAFGPSYDCGDFAATLDRALALADRAGFADRRRAAAERGRLRGQGIAMPIEVAGGPPKTPNGDVAEVRIDPDGEVSVISGAVSSGQGHETGMTRMVAAALGVDAARVRYVQADTAVVPDGRGSGGSGGAAVSVSAVALTVDALLDEARAVAARLLGVAAEDVEPGEGLFRARGSNRSASLADIARAADAGLGLRVKRAYRPDGATWPNGAHVAEVEIDPETGLVEVISYAGVEDVGTVLDPVMVDGQMQGGIAQGLGQALGEALIHDEAGQLLTGTLMDYAMPRAADLPFLRLETLPVPTAKTRLGAKGVGEAGTVGALAAVMNAVNDALAQAGAGPIDMPASPGRVWAALQARPEPSA